MIFKSPAGTIIFNNYNGKDIAFFVTNERDVIQSYHAQGRFYEVEHIETTIHNHFPKGGVFLDIGANIGNHLLFVAKYMEPGKIIPIEPNPSAIHLLMTNIKLNGIEKLVDVSYLGVGLSDRDGQANPVIPEGNLGGTSLASDSNGAIKLIRGDVLLKNERIDFIKLDVEMMEMEVLRGISGIIDRDRPPMFVEITIEYTEQFKEWLKEKNYVITLTHSPYWRYNDYMIMPAEKL